MATQKLRNFVVVAEELNLSRAAPRLFVTQQALSKQLRDLEEAVGVRLFDRSTRSMALTPAGEEFLASVREALAALDAGVVAARSASQRVSGTVRLGFLMGGALELTTPILAEFSARYPDVRLELRETGLDDPSAGLADATSDVAIVRLPLAVPDLDSVPLFVEPLIVALPPRHRLADRTSLTAEDVIDEPLAIGRTTDAVWRRFWTLDDHRGGRPPRVVRETTSPTEELQLVAAGLACTITVVGARRHTPLAGVRYVPLTGLPGSTVAVAWRRGHRSPGVERFVAVAQQVRDRESAIVRAIEAPPA
ncbi:LysR family transcriptional regulator [Streptomyces sp. e14]|uniref:LysR family transcriptional regulator n=1 Tax=Streptomyces sp. e14 TaxID=645465 RepID=UPI000304C165|nr:LysR substrate-binding domain-containing protein [Streptomyces sp. e14]